MLTMQCIRNDVRVTIYSNDQEQEFWCYVTFTELNDFVSNVTESEKIIKVGPGQFIGIEKSYDYNSILLKFYRIGANTPPVNGAYKIDLDSCYYNIFKINTDVLNNAILEVEFAPLEIELKIEA